MRISLFESYGKMTFELKLPITSRRNETMKTASSSSLDPNRAPGAATTKKIAERKTKPRYYIAWGSPQATTEVKYPILVGQKSI